MLYFQCRTARSPLALAEQAAAGGNEEAAAALYAQEVRQDMKATSYRALLKLDEMKSPAALDWQVGLLDLPDGQWIGKTAREELWRSIRRRAETIAPSLYSPDAPLAQRRAQQEAVRRWVDEAKRMYSWEDGRFKPVTQRSHDTHD